jgi:hypothetical protein
MICLPFESSFYEDLNIGLKKHVTDGKEVSTPDFYTGGPGLKSQLESDYIYWIWWCYYYIEISIRIVRQNSLLLLLSASFTSNSVI